MANNVNHFAIHADDVERARSFYEQVFGWRFTPWGPPGFFQIETGTPEDPGIAGALHGRQEPLTGTGMRGYECTISVDDLDAIRTAAVDNGAQILIEEFTIPTVGTMAKILDTEGNVVTAMRYRSG